MPLHDKQLSTSQIMRLSFALALAMGANNDKLKLLCIPRGESLDKKSLGALKEFLQEHPEWQAFCEVVSQTEEELKVEYFETT